MEFFLRIQILIKRINSINKIKSQKYSDIKMAGAGKSGKGVGKVGAKRHAKKTTK